MKKRDIFSEIMEGIDELSNGGYYDEEGYWVQTKMCKTDCGSKCNCLPPNGYFLKPGSPAQIANPDPIFKKKRKNK